MKASTPLQASHVWLGQKSIYTVFAGLVLAGGMALEAVSPMRADAQHRGTINGFKTDICTKSPDRIPGIADFRQPCIQHDRCYFDARRNSRGKEGLRECDRRFARALVRACRRQHGRFSPRRAMCYDAAARYAGAVRVITETGRRRLTP